MELLLFWSRDDYNVWWKETQEKLHTSLRDLSSNVIHVLPLTFNAKSHCLTLTSSTSSPQLQGDGEVCPGGDLNTEKQL